MSSGRSTQVSYYQLGKVNKMKSTCVWLKLDGLCFVVISSEVDQCQPGPCANGSTCVSQDNTYICICPSKYQGRNCDKGNISNYI